jgi:hypothetical protein
MKIMQQLDDLTKDRWLRALLSLRPGRLGVNRKIFTMEMLSEEAVNNTGVSTKMGCTVLIDEGSIMICAMKMEKCSMERL